jgi:ribosome recycling factor
MDDLQPKLQKVLDVLRQDLATIRTGRATPSLVENIVVSAYNGSARLRVMELATIGSVDSHTLQITPFDVSIIQDIEKGIREANIGLNPVVDGQVLRISIPPLTQERREELIKAMKHKLENGRIMIRQVRHEAMDTVKKTFAENKDELERQEKEVQKVIDQTMELIESLGQQKEEELMQM